MEQPDYSNEELERARKLFAGPCDFMRGIADLDQLPDPVLPEIAFIGRSNVGKSSLINALTGRKALARTSNTPGRTQQMNFFDLGSQLCLVDLPGYGYAKVSKSLVKAWTQMIFDYLRGRVPLRRGLVLIDGRHGIKESDLTIMKMMDDAAVNYQIILTKCDKVKQAELAKRVESIEAALKKHPAALPYIHTTSAHKDQGIAELRASFLEFS